MIATYERKANGVKLFAAVAVLAMVLAGTAVMMSDDGVDAAPGGDTTYLSGAITATQEYGTGTNVVVNGNLTIPSGMSMIISDTGKLTIEAGNTLTIEAGGQLILQGKPTVIVNGNIVAEGTSDNADYKGAIINNTKYDSTNGTGVIVSGSITIEKGAEISTSDGEFSVGNYQVDSYSGGNGSILLNSGATFNVTQQSRYVSEIGNQDILMNAGSTVKINGKITGTVGIDAVGSGTYYTAGGIELGNVAESTSTSKLTFTVTSQNTSALVTADAKSPITLRQYILNVDGTLDGATMTSIQGTYNGSNAFYEATGYGYQYYPTVSVTGNLSVVDGGNNVTVGNESTVNVSGTIEFEYDDDVDVSSHSTATINGSLIVSGTMSASYFSGFLTISQDDTSERIVVNGGTMALTIVGNLDMSDLAQFANAHLYGTMYQVDGGTNTDDIIYIQDFDDAVAGAVAGESDSVTVYAWGAHNKDYDVQDAADRGAYVITSDITIPDGLEVIIQNALIVGEGATMTIEEGATITFEGMSRSYGPAVLWVEGKVVDYDGIMGDYENTDLTTTDNGIFMYEVKKTTDTDSEYYITYTTLKIALSEAQSGETIDLNGCVTIDENMTIPEGVTVAADAEEEKGIIVMGATLTVNGVLDMNDTQFELTTKQNGQTVGNIVVNNYIVDVDYENYKVWDLAEKYLDGAYFNGIVGDAETESNYISTVEIAANASSTVTDCIRIFGNVDMGDVEFTAADELTDGLTVYIYNDTKDVATAGTITINSDVKLNTDSGDLTGTIAGAGATITVDGNKDTTFTVVTVGADEQATYQMQIFSMNGLSGTATSDGSITIESGTVYIVGNFKTDDMTVADGATLVIGEEGTLSADANPAYRFNTTPGSMPLFTENLASNLAGLTVEGTITVEGDLIAGVLYVNGTIDIADTGSLTSSVMAYINGSVSSEKGADVNYVVAVLNGTLSGDVSAEFVAAFPGSDVTGANIVAPGTSGINSTNYYVNGEQVATVYAKNGVSGELVLLLTDVNGVKYESSRFYIDSDMTDCVTDFNTADGKTIYDSLNNVISGFRDITYDATNDTYDFSKFKTALGSVAGNFDVGDYENVYIGMEPADVTGTISVGTGLNLYIDSLAWSPSNGYKLGVGTHTVSFDVTAGYDGSNATITFNGQNVENGGTIEITADMTSFTLVVSGAVPSSGQTVVIDNGNGGDSGMGLTDYLLIILVILIVIMAIIVALRLMRS